MNEQFIIMKATRNPANLAGEVDAYRGATCERARVTPGRVYDDLSEAVRDAYALDARNGVGFRIWRVGDGRPVGATTESWYLGDDVPRLVRP